MDQHSNYILAAITGSDLIDATGCATGPEVTRIYSKHRTLRGAYRAQRALCGWAACPVILTADHKRLSPSDRKELDALQAGA